MSDIAQNQAKPFRQWRDMLTTPWTVVVAAPLAVLIFDPVNAAGVATFAVSAFAGTLPYIAFAVLLIAG